MNSNTSTSPKKRSKGKCCCGCILIMVLLYFIFGMLITNYFVNGNADYQIYRQQQRIEQALKEYHVNNVSYPETLSDLVDQHYLVIHDQYEFQRWYQWGTKRKVSYTKTTSGCQFIMMVAKRNSLITLANPPTEKVTNQGDISHDPIQK